MLKTSRLLTAADLKPINFKPEQRTVQPPAPPSKGHTKKFTIEVPFKGTLADFEVTAAPDPDNKLFSKATLKLMDKELVGTGPSPRSAIAQLKDEIMAFLKETGLDKAPERHDFYSGPAEEPPLAVPASWGRESSVKHADAENTHYIEDFTMDAEFSYGDGPAHRPWAQYDSTASARVHVCQMEDDPAEFSYDVDRVSPSDIDVDYSEVESQVRAELEKVCNGPFKLTRA